CRPLLSPLLPCTTLFRSGSPRYAPTRCCDDTRVLRAAHAGRGRGARSGGPAPPVPARCGPVPPRGPLRLGRRPAVRPGEGLHTRSEEHTSELQSLTNLVC